MFAHDEKLKSKVCLKVYVDCTKNNNNNQTLTWRISKIIICSTLALFVKNLLVFQHNVGLRWYVVLGHSILKHVPYQRRYSIPLHFSSSLQFTFTEYH